MCRSLLPEQLTEKSIPQFPGRRFHADLFLCRASGHVFAAGMEFQIVLASQPRDEFLIGIGLRPSQFVIEMNNGKHDAEFMPQFQQQP